MTIKTWEPNIGPIVIRNEVKNMKVITKLYYMFCIQFEGSKPIERTRGPHYI
jgi:hypothetical protein